MASQDFPTGGSGEGSAQSKPPARSAERPHDALLVFVRAPVRGRVKTRLARAMGDDAALRIYRRLAEHTVMQAMRLAREDGVEVRIHHTPAAAGHAVRDWLGPGPLYLPQSGGGLGERMHDAFAHAFANGRGRVVIVGSDLPDLDAELMRRAFTLLDAHRAVIGPARDGGYYLLGLTELPRGIFAGIEWSTPTVLAETLRRMRALGMVPMLLEEMRDVDEAADVPEGWVEEG
ncbi:MAG TPA: TIGR04282 family arsenosugar biosynthesis glycosyltransferase [Longimicrobium sp.]|nr:TIGR04282 family arsenosugar biosynthesis glycosyltransferase [Longimicrobium sp.]